MKLKFIVFILLLASLNANAFFIAANTNKIDSTKPTHILMVGNGEKLGELFSYSALTKSQVLKDKYPENQIIILGRNEDQNLIMRSGFKILESNSEMLKEKTLENALELIVNVRSIDIFAHSNAKDGIIIDKNSDTVQGLDEKDHVWSKLLSKVSKDSYIMIHGCNSGIKLGPALARKLHIAVLASLTSTDFQHIYKDSFWSQDSRNLQGKLSEINKLSFSEGKECKDGYCTRMKPDNSSYNGYWGDWSEGGYSTFKIFCGSNNNLTCGKGAVEAVSTFPSIIPAKYVKSVDQFKEIVIDFMCPFGHDSVKQNECKNALENSLLNNAASTYSPFVGTTLNCDFEKCFAHFKCGFFNSSFDPRSCKLKNEKPGANQTFTNDYKFLIKAFLQK